MNLDPKNIFKQVQKTQQNMARLQESLKERYVDASAGGGMVTAIVNGHQELMQIKIDPEVVDPEDVGMLEDMVLAAVNQAMQKAREMYQKEMAKVTGGMDLGALGNMLGGLGGF